MEEAANPQMFQGGAGKTDATSETQGQDCDIHGVRIGVIIIIFDRAQAQKQGLILRQAVDHVLHHPFCLANAGMTLNGYSLNHIFD
jgi:hypothetical protein